MIRLFNKSAKHRGIVGIDFRADGMAVVVLKARSGATTPVLVHGDFFPVTQSLDRKKALQSIVSEHQLAGAPCVALMEADHYQLLQVEAPSVEDEELRAAVRWRIKDLIGYPVESAVIDVFKLPQAARRGSDTLYVVVAQSDSVRERVEIVRASGLKLKALDIVELALRNIAARLPQNGPGLALLTLHERRGLIALIKNSELYLSRELDVGLDNLADPAGDPLLSPGLSFEGLSHEGSSHETVVLELQRSLDYFESAFAQPSLGKLLVYPGDARAEPLLTYLRTSLTSIDSVSLQVEDLVEPADNLTESCSVNCLQAVGAALRELDDAA